MSAVWALACGDSTPATPFESIPKDTMLVDLTPSEQEGTCNWTTQVAQSELAGQTLSCDGQPLTLNTCHLPNPSQTDCTATVGQWEQCFPQFFQRIVQDPCEVLDLAFSQSELEDFVNGTPGCDGLGPCAYTMP